MRVVAPTAAQAAASGEAARGTSIDGAVERSLVHVSVRLAADMQSEQLLRGLPRVCFYNCSHAPQFFVCAENNHIQKTITFYARGCGQMLACYRI